MKADAYTKNKNRVPFYAGLLKIGGKGELSSMIIGIIIIVPSCVAGIYAVSYVANKLPAIP